MAKRKADDRAFINHGNLKIPVLIYFERRRNTRISIGAESIHLRLSRNLNKKELTDQITWAEKWLHKRFEKAPTLLERFKTVHFKHGDRIQIMRDTFVLHIQETALKSSKAKLNGNDVMIQLSEGMDAVNRHKTIDYLFHKILCKRYHKFIVDRVLMLNRKHFKQPISDIKIKYISSKWGSCSSEGEIILSSKLLLCPDFVRDYVIVHELAHLIEQNHSDAFWNTVESAMPNYEKAEAWLKNDGVGVEIRPLAQIHFSKSDPLVINQTIDEPSLTEKPILTEKQEASEDQPIHLPEDEVKHDVPTDNVEEVEDANTLISAPVQTAAPTPKVKSKKKSRKIKKKDSKNKGEQLSLF